MRLSAVIQLIEEDPIIGELEEPPDPAAQFVTVFNPRRRDGRTIAFLDSNVDRVPVSYTHLRAHETVLDLVCRLLLEKKNKKN